MDARIGTSQHLPALTVTGKPREAGMSTLDLGGGRIVVLNWQMNAETAQALDDLRTDLAVQAEAPKAPPKAAKRTLPVEPTAEGGEGEPETDRP